MRPSLKPLTRQSKELVERNVIYSAVSANACAGAASSKVMIFSSEMMSYSSLLMIHPGPDLRRLVTLYALFTPGGEWGMLNI